MFRDKTLEALIEAAVACGEVAQQECRQGLKIEAKTGDVPGVAFTTQADKLGQEAGLAVLKRFLPDKVTIAEETDGQSAVPANCTVFDPLDGTINARDGRDQWGCTL